MEQAGSLDEVLQAGQALAQRPDFAAQLAADGQDQAAEPDQQGRTHAEDADQFRAHARGLAVRTIQWHAGFDEAEERSRGYARD